MREIGGVSPRFQVRRSEDSNGEFLRIGHDHHPGGGGGIPYNLRISKLGAICTQDWVATIFCESVAIICGVSYFLGLGSRVVESIDCYYAVGGIWEESTGVIWVQDGRTTEDGVTSGRGKNRDGLVGPMVEILRGRMPPVLIAGYDASRIVYLMVRSLD